MQTLELDSQTSDPFWGLRYPFWRSQNAFWVWLTLVSSCWQNTLEEGVLGPFEVFCVLSKFVRHCWQHRKFFSAINAKPR